MTLQFMSLPSGDSVTMFHTNAGSLQSGRGRKQEWASALGSGNWQQGRSSSCLCRRCSKGVTSVLKHAVVP